MSQPNLALASTAIGIDMGTTYCYVGVYKNNSVEVIANEQGNRATPAFLSFTPKERVVGEAAYNHQHLNQQNTIYHAKSLLGYDYKDAAFQKILSESKFPFSVLEGANGRPVVEVEFQGKPTQFTAEELVGVLFKQIKQTASQYMGANISKAVISVPSHYTEKQKAALLEAAKLGEIEVLALCDEPAAVAMAYKLDEPTAASSAHAAHQHVVVVDCGGMSTNITILGVQNGIMEILGFDQDTHLGGEHIDEKLVDYFAAEFKRKNDGLDVTQSARAMTRLRHGAEKAKVVLSAAMSAPIELDALYEGADLFSSITRSKFEALLQADFLKRVTGAIDRALKNAGVEKDDVQSLIVSGGSGKIPKLKDTIAKHFGSSKCKLLTGVQSVDEAVAFGCAIQASLLVTATADASVSDVSEVKLNALAIGIENASGEMQVLIPKNTPLPTIKSVTCHVTKGGLIKVFEGEVIKSAAKNHLLGTLALKEATASGANVKVEITMDVNGAIEVHATIGKTRENLVIPAGAKQLSAKEIESALAAGHAEHLELLVANKVLAAQASELELRGSAIKSEMASGVLGGALQPADQKIMGKAIDDISAWLESITVGPILHTKKEDLERKAKGLEILFAGYQKKIDAKKNAPAPVEAAKPKAAAAAPAPMMDSGDLD